MEDDSPSNVNEFSVSELAGALKRVVEDAFGRVRVRGEISGYRGPHSSGHAYFSVKDERATIQAIIWKGAFTKLKFLPEEGMEVIATGRMTTYPGRSNYQIVIDQLEPAGAGALMALLEARRKKLAAEGLFDDSRKKPIPYLPKKIGVITSPTGAVIRDIVHRISDRFPVPLLVWPVRVQGDTTGAEVARAIEGFNALLDDAPDLIIIARGGGSLEDLWGFNDEAIVRAVAASHIPIISAVGHETDWTLIDHAADLRAPTPTGAAEMAVPVKSELEATLASLKARLAASHRRQMERRTQLLQGLARALPSADSLLSLPRRRFDDSEMRLARAFDVTIHQRRQRFQATRLEPTILLRSISEKKRQTHHAMRQLTPALGRGLAMSRQRLNLTGARLSPNTIERQTKQSDGKLLSITQRFERSFADVLAAKHQRMRAIDRLFATLSHKSVLARGFALIRNQDGDVLSSSAEATQGSAIAVEFADGRIDALVMDGTAVKKQLSKKPKPDGTLGQSQGNLL